MGTKDIPFDKLEPLIIKHLSKDEYEQTAELIKELSVAIKRGFLTKDELIKICQWKSPRAIRHIKSNTSPTIKKITSKVFDTNYEKEKIELLRELKGVSIPMASAILMLTNPKRYGVIDIRVWQLLYKIGTVKTNPKGLNFSFQEWYRYLKIIQYFAKNFKVKARDIERTLFQVHKLYQDGLLYE